MLKPPKVFCPGAEPYCLNRAAQHLEKMASNIVERLPPLPIGRFFGAGPALGRAAHGNIPQGVDYNPVSRISVLRKFAAVYNPCDTHMNIYMEKSTSTNTFLLPSTRVACVYLTLSDSV